MVNLSEFLDIIQENLKAFTEATEVIFAEQNGQRPKEPFIVIKLSSFGQDGIHPIITNKQIEGTNDIEVSLVKFPKLVLSITCYSSNPLELAQKAREWFDLREYSKSIFEQFNAVVRDLTDAQNRSVVLADMIFEKKWGFDVTIELNNTIKFTSQTIEGISIKEGI